jgi:hypothetical protein
MQVGQMDRKASCSRRRHKKPWKNSGFSVFCLGIEMRQGILSSALGFDDSGTTSAQ